MPSVAVAHGSPAAPHGATTTAGVARRGMALLAIVAGLAGGCTTPTPPVAAPEAMTPSEPVAAAPPPSSPADDAQGAAAPVATPPPVATPHPAAEGRIRDISFDDVKLPLAKGDPYTADVVPDTVKALERQRVRIRGYILPSFQQRGITQFVLVRDNMECCFGPGALLHDCIVVRMVPGASTDFSIRPVAVTGVFRFEELKGPDGKHLAVYAMDGEDVR